MKPLASKLQCSLSIREHNVREIGLHFFSKRIALFLELNMTSKNVPKRVEVLFARKRTVSIFMIVSGLT